MSWLNPTPEEARYKRDLEDWQTIRQWLEDIASMVSHRKMDDIAKGFAPWASVEIKAEKSSSILAAENLIVVLKSLCVPAVESKGGAL